MDTLTFPQEVALRVATNLLNDPDVTEQIPDDVSKRAWIGALLWDDPLMDDALESRLDAFLPAVSHPGPCWWCVVHKSVCGPSGSCGCPCHVHGIRYRVDLE